MRGQFVKSMNKFSNPHIRKRTSFSYFLIQFRENISLNQFWLDSPFN